MILGKPSVVTARPAAPGSTPVSNMAILIPRPSQCGCSAINSPACVSSRGKISVVGKPDATKTAAAAYQCRAASIAVLRHAGSTVTVVPAAVRIVPARRCARARRTRVVPRSRAPVGRAPAGRHTRSRSIYARGDSTGLVTRQNKIISRDGRESVMSSGSICVEFFVGRRRQMFFVFPLVARGSLVLVMLFGVQNVPAALKTLLGEFGGCIAIWADFRRFRVCAQCLGPKTPDLASIETPAKSVGRALLTSSGCGKDWLGSDGTPSSQLK